MTLKPIHGILITIFLSLLLGSYFMHSPDVFGKYDRPVIQDAMVIDKYTYTAGLRNDVWNGVILKSYSTGDIFEVTVSKDTYYNVRIGDNVTYIDEGASRKYVREWE